MTINKRDLRNIERSRFEFFTPLQRKLILERFSTEPDEDCPWLQWTEQDIFEQIRHICRDNPAPPPPMPDWMKEEQNLKS